ncbi:MAG: RNA polymerase sigma factor [Limisphaerales bacterium]
MTADLDLLQQFARENSQDVFNEIVRRHVNLVYSAALRQVRSPQLAEEVAQSVFADLARSAGRLKPDTILIAWLYAVTRRTAIDVIRKESRRQLREQIALEMNTMNATANEWAQIEPTLDDAMAALEETDRNLILLRYFENKSLREIGDCLKISDDAAQKRASRALERLREFFTKQNVTIGVGGLAVLISANAVQAAPIGLAATISAAALTGATISCSTVITATKIIAMTTLQKIVVTAAIAVLAGAGIYETGNFAKRHGGAMPPIIETNVYVSRAEFAPASYATPDSTIKSLFFIQSKGDIKATLDSASPAFRAILEKALQITPQGERTLSNSIIEESKYYLGYRISGVEKISDDKMVVTVLVDDARLNQTGQKPAYYFVVKAKSHKKWQLVRINSEWKYDGAPDEPNNKSS